MSLFRYVLLSLLISSQVSAKPLRFVTFTIPLMVENRDKGLFIELTKEIAKRNNLDVSIDLMPPAKSFLAFSGGQAEALFPALEGDTPKNGARSVAFYEKVDFVFYREGHPFYTVKDLSGKKVGLTFRYRYAHEILDNKKIHFEYADDDVTNMKKLSRGELDAFIAEERSGIKALQVSGAKNIQYKNSQPISREAVFYAFQDSEEGRSLAQRFSKTIAKLKSEGLFDQIMVNHPKTKILE